jgi:UPF0042 nucleotide-binding protein
MVAIDNTPGAPAESPQRILLVTGLLGAGKTTALRTLEDLGWEAIDNFPIRLLDRLLETEPGQARADGGSAEANTRWRSASTRAPAGSIRRASSSGSSR